MNNIIFFGPPGAGKGTQANLISKYLNLPHLSTGEILRSKINKKDSIAKQLRSIMNKGDLVSDEILNQIVSNELMNSENGFILDGYPRTIKQANFINNFFNKNALKISFIFNIDINFETLKKRILKRSEEESREDDNINTLKTRYELYTRTTRQVSDDYRLKNPEIFFEIDGRDQIEEITKKIKKILKN